MQILTAAAVLSSGEVIATVGSPLDPTPVLAEHLSNLNGRVPEFTEVLIEDDGGLPTISHRASREEGDTVENFSSRVLLNAIGAWRAA